ncbi:hypothetical protein ACWDE9_47490, partial [Streptomyces olivaceoviridis]
IHEALMHSYAPDVTETTCVAILQPGYRIGDEGEQGQAAGRGDGREGAGQVHGHSCEESKVSHYLTSVASR